MSRLLAVAARELRERWLLFPASLVLGFNSLVFPAFGVDRQAMPLVGLMTAVGLGTAAAVVMGSTMLARDAANGRLGFLFSRPLSWQTIWGGKWLAALVLVASSSALAAIPFMAVYPPETHGGSWLRAVSDGPGWSFLLTLFVLVVGIANFCATAYRSRSPWVALDMALLAGGLWATRRYVAPLLLFGVLRSDWGHRLALLLLAFGLLAGSAVQTAAGRSDLRRGHRALSLVFWAVVGLTLAAAAGYWQWVRSAGPENVSAHALTRDPTGRWIYVEGSGSRGGLYPYCFLIDAVNGRYLVPRERDEHFPFGALFSADGRFAALPSSDARGAAVLLYDLTGGSPRATTVPLESSPPPDWRTRFALSPSARFVFMAHESGASIFALPSGRRVATTTIAPGWRPAAVQFVVEDEARAWLVPSYESVPRAEMRIVVLAADGRSSTVAFPLAAALGPASSWRAVAPDAGGRRIVTLDAGAHLRDGATGAVLATLAASGGRVETMFLSDGRIVVAEPRFAAGETGRPGATLRVSDRDGHTLHETQLDLQPMGLSVGPEVAPGRILVSSFRSPFLAEDTLVVDVADGRVIERLGGLRPAMAFWMESTSPVGTGPGSIQFFRDDAGRVIRLDLATGARATVAGPGAPRGERLRGN